MIKNSSAFSIEETDDGCLNISLLGEIDHHSAVKVRCELDELLFQKRPKNVVLDLSGISFMDSSGLGLIMGRYTLLRDLGGKLTIKDPSPRVEKILTLSGMEKMIKITKSEDKK